MTALQDVRVEGEVVKKNKHFHCEARDSKILLGNKQAVLRKKRATKKTADDDQGGAGSESTGE
ncbi:hypothetical protein A3197_01540 [Candidatus Thiodiazotropha endoloripes]|nr:hypothetical protein A3197_01540 [Candidatus Thiodiazotropha endoloripes]